MGHPSPSDSSGVHPASASGGTGGALSNIFARFSRWVDRYTGLSRLVRKPASFPVQPARFAVQLFFLLVVVNVGFRFAAFVNSLGTTGPVAPRPAGVEAWLPISSLVSLRYLIMTGTWSPIHPAGLALFLIAIATGLLLKRAFCSWVCPIGFLSEFLAKLGFKISNKKFTLPPWLDWPLRMLKYLLLLFFIFAIMVAMKADALKSFIASPYNKVADIKMMLFFTKLSATAAIILGLLLVLSVFIPYFWCRYLCPYGALLGFTGVYSAIKVRRNEDTCINCGQCTKMCPAAITVHKLDAVVSDECNACMLCVDACPVEDTLYFSPLRKTPRRRGFLQKYWLAFAVLAFFAVGVGIASLTGHWRSNITPDEYRMHFSRIDNPEYTHSAAMEQGK